MAELSATQTSAAIGHGGSSDKCFRQIDATSTEKRRWRVGTSIGHGTLRVRAVVLAHISGVLSQELVIGSVVCVEFNKIGCAISGSCRHVLA